MKSKKLPYSHPTLPDVTLTGPDPIDDYEMSTEFDFSNGIVAKYWIPSQILKWCEKYNIELTKESFKALENLMEEVKAKGLIEE